MEPLGQTGSMGHGASEPAGAPDGYAAAGSYGWYGSPGPMGRPRGGVGVLLGLRVVMSLLVGALGVVLLVAGYVLIGGLLLALAVVRLAMTAILWSRRRHRRQQFAARRGARGRYDQVI
jgi:hypothetical protein